MDKIDKAKKLLRLGIDIGDNDLIMMAHEILGISGNDEQLNTEQIKENPKTEQPQIKTDKRDSTDFSLFTMKTDEDVSKKNGIAVNKIRREIKFIDDGSDKHIETPIVSLAERKRPAFKMIEQQCQKCGKSVTTHPSHKREWFVCDRCIKK